MEYILESLRGDWQSLLHFAPRLVYALALLLVSLVIARAMGRLTARLLRRAERLRTNEIFLRRLVSWAVASVGILLALGVLGLKGIAASMLATGGVVAIVLGFAFREIGENLLAGFFLTFARPFEIGDLVTTGGLTGVVRAIELRSVHLRTGDACDVFVPSAQIFREPLYNYTRDGLRRPSFTIGVAFHDEPERVIALLTAAANAVADVLDDPPAVVTIKEFSAQYVEYEVIVWIDVTRSERGLVAISNDVKIECWRALRDAGVTFSTDVSSSLDIRTTPRLEIDLTGGGPASG